MKYLKDMHYIDIGVNLMGKSFNNKRDEIVKNSYEDSVGFIITGTSIESNNQAIKFINKFETELKCELYTTCGMHPHNADSWIENKNIKEQYENTLSNNKVIAIGEIGLDFDRMYSKKDSQIKCFSEILDISESVNKPLFLHERSAEYEFINLLKKHRNLCKRSVVHCFTGSKETALRYLNLGCYIGITGWICDYKRNSLLLDAIKVIPVDRLLVETDAPYLIPKNVRGLGGNNIPNNVKYVVREIAKLKNISEEALRVQLLKNTFKFFNLDSSLE